MSTTAEKMERDYCNPATGSIKRRWLRRKLNGIVAVGKTDLHPEPPAPSGAEQHERKSLIEKTHSQTVIAEIAALDAHAAIVTQHIEVLESTSGASSFSLQEMKAEHRQLRELRQMLLDDQSQGPIARNRDGREIDDRDRAIIRARAAETREALWAQATRCDASGERREARQLRRDALRARMIVEYESRWRTSLPGYGIAAWN